MKRLFGRIILSDREFDAVVSTAHSNAYKLGYQAGETDERNMYRAAMGVTAIDHTVPRQWLRELGITVAKAP